MLQTRVRIPVLFCVLPIAMVLALGAVVNAPEAETVSDGLDRVVLSQYAKGAIHGGILVAEGNKVIYERALGIADYDTGATLEVNQRFTINSQGKMFTAVLVMQLVEEGELALEQSLAEMLPAYAHPRAGDITLHHLLAHRSGLPDYFLRLVLAGVEGASEASMHEMLDMVRGMDLDFEPGTMFHYSNTGYVLLGQIVEAKRGAPFAAAMQRHLFGPLGMADSEPAAAARGEGMPDYLSSDGRINGEPPTSYFGDGSEISTLRDMHRFMAAIGSEVLLEPASWELMFKPHSLPTEVPEGAWPPPHMHPYGYGFSITELPFDSTGSATAVGHGGAGFGSSNMAVRFLDSGRIVVNYNTVSKDPMLMDVILHLAGR